MDLPVTGAPMTDVPVARLRLEETLRTLPAAAIAVSGGVDSLTLAALCGLLGVDMLAVHARSPAVPAEATARVERIAAERGWNLLIVDAGEFADANYRANPVNRCFYCKSSLYRTIASSTGRLILSGANLDDLGEYRPGLDAARVYAVRHPYVEAGMDKRAVRALARELELAAVAELPASPCLSSRMETGLRIDERALAFIHAVEQWVAEQFAPQTVRCRVRASAIVIELDAAGLARARSSGLEHLTSRIAAHPLRPGDRPIRFEAYRNGSAFLRQSA
jgi:uncharacterized protein